MKIKDCGWKFQTIDENYRLQIKLQTSDENYRLKIKIKD